jgi:hypothetical protein
LIITINGKAEKEKRNGFCRAIKYDSPQFLPIMKEIYEWSHIFSKILVVFADKWNKQSSSLTDAFG